MSTKCLKDSDSALRIKDIPFVIKYISLYDWIITRV